MKTSLLKLKKRALLRAFGIRKFSALKLWEGKSPFDGSDIMAVMANHASMSANTKIGGNFCQIFILAKDEKPVVTYESKKPSVCGSCPHLGAGCYVAWFRLKSLYDCTVDQVPLLSMLGGHLLLKELVKDQFMRLGAAGDPLALPFWLADLCVKGSFQHTAYTHQWMNLDLPDLDKWQGLCMASVDSELEMDAANSLGWRTFRTVKGEMKLKKSAKELECIAARDERRFKDNLKLGIYKTDDQVEKAKAKVNTCETCRLCDGNRRNKKQNVAIFIHGAKVSRYKTDDFKTHPKFSAVRDCLG